MASEQRVEFGKNKIRIIISLKIIMITERRFLETVQSICESPKMYTANGSYYEVVSFLEGYSIGANLENYYYHSKTTPFRKWISQKFSIQKIPVDWKDFEELFSSDLEALQNLPILYEEIH